MGRAPCCAKVGLKRGRWSTEEDRILVEYITVNGEGSWRSLPKNSGLLRCGKSCRLRWLNYLRADVKRGNISKEEEETIIKLQTSMGNRWSLIASHLPGRTDNEIKNYWNSYLSRTVDSLRRMGMVALADANARNPGIGCVRRKGGRTRRSSMKKKNSTSSSSSTRARKMRESRENGENYQATKEILDVEYLGLSDEIRGLLDPTQGVDIGPWPIEEEGEISGVMSSSDQEREGGALVVGGPLDLGGVVGLGEEEVGSDQSSDQVEKMLLDWELGMGANLWDEGEGMMCPWPWEFGDGGELGHQGMEGGGPQVESLANWLLSDAF